MSGGVEISEAAYEAAGRAAADVAEKWHSTPNREAYVGTAIGQAARVGVQAAAPLITADELESLAAALEIPESQYGGYDDPEGKGFLRANQQLCEVLRVRAYVIRSAS